MRRLGAIARATALPLAGLVATYVALVLLPWGRAFDTAAIHGRWASGWRIRQLDIRLLSTISGASLVMVLVIVVAIAVVQGRWRTGLGSAVAVLGALTTVEVLKIVLPSPALYGTGWRYLSISQMGSFPSGHSVIVASVALAVLAISPPSLRRLAAGPLVAAVVVFTTATVTMGWHRPSDVLGAFFVATVWQRGVLTLLTPQAALDRPVMAAQVSRSVKLVSGVWLVGCWALASALVVGAAAKGVIDGAQFPLGRPNFSTLPDLGSWPSLGGFTITFDHGNAVAYAGALAGLALAGGLAIVAGFRWLNTRPSPTTSSVATGSPATRPGSRSASPGVTV